jgi:hypothetical protein
MELKGGRVLSNDVGGLIEFLCGLKLSFLMDDFGTGFAFGLCLSGGDPLHVLRNIDILSHNGHDLHSPWFGLLIDGHGSSGLNTVRSLPHSVDKIRELANQVKPHVGRRVGAETDNSLTHSNLR